jgi:hypothetical protein
MFLNPHYKVVIRFWNCIYTVIKDLQDLHSFVPLSVHIPFFHLVVFQCVWCHKKAKNKNNLQCVHRRHMSETWFISPTLLRPHIWHNCIETYINQVLTMGSENFIFGLWNPSSRSIDINQDGKVWAFFSMVFALREFRQQQNYIASIMPTFSRKITRQLFGAKLQSHECMLSIAPAGSQNWSTTTSCRFEFDTDTYHPSLLEHKIINKVFLLAKLQTAFCPHMQ